jgi:putative hydrolase of HD superfamily
MVLLHDLAESKIGDFTPDQITKDKKEKIENNAFYEIIENLPESIKLEYVEIWKEYQNQISLESKIVHQIDRLEMALQAKTYQKDGLSKEDITTFLETAKSDITHPKLQQLFRKIVEDN